MNTRSEIKTAWDVGQTHWRPEYVLQNCNDRYMLHVICNTRCIGGYRGVPGGPDPPPFEYQKSIAIACQRGIKTLPRNNTRSKLSVTTYEIFSSRPTFSDIDLVQAIYMASRGSPKLFLALTVTSFIDSLHTHTARTCTHTHTRTHAHTHTCSRARSPQVRQCLPTKEKNTWLQWVSPLSHCSQL